MAIWTGAARTVVCSIDRALLRYYGIFEFSDVPACVLRLGPARAQQNLLLRDGTFVVRGEPLLQIHLWNERLPAFAAPGATLAWGLDIARRVRASLCLLARFLACAPQFDAVQVLRAEIGFLEVNQFPQLRALAESLGFDFKADVPPGRRFWKRAFWANLYSWWLMWTFNPASLRGKDWAELARCELWLSRATLIEKYGKGCDRAG